MDKGLKHYRGIMQGKSKPANTNKRVAKRQRRLLSPRKTQNPIIPMSELLEAIWGKDKEVKATKEEVVTFKDHEKECKACMTYNFCEVGLSLLNKK
jgi:hypothetical protein